MTRRELYLMTYRVRSAAWIAKRNMMNELIGLEIGDVDLEDIGVSLTDRKLDVDLARNVTGEVVCSKQAQCEEQGRHPSSPMGAHPLQNIDELLPHGRKT